MTRALIKNVGNPAEPGTIASFGGDVIPSGWLVCDGTEIDRTIYSALYTVVANAWGEGNGSTTFHLPDLRGRFLRGKDDGAGNDPDVGTRLESNTGGNTGDDVGSIQEDDMKPHFHVVPYDTPPAGNATHMSIIGRGDRSDQGHNRTNVDGGTGGDTRPKNASVIYIIKA